jgi:hypothetical protein
MKWCERKVSFWIWVVFIFGVSFGAEIVWPLMYSIKETEYTNQFNQTVNGYYPMSSSLTSTVNFGMFGIIESIIKDITSLIILLSLNCYILFKLIQIGRRKKRLTTNSSNIQNSTNAEIRKIFMIIVLFFVFLLGHLPNFLWYIIRSYTHLNQFLNDITECGAIILYFSYSTSLLVYFAFNVIFRRYLMKLFEAKMV